MKHLLLIFSIAIFYSCQSDSNPSNNTENTATSNEPTPAVTEAPKSKDVFDQATSDYSMSFQRAIATQNQFKNVILWGDKIILDNSDTISFPQEPTLNKIIELKGKNEQMEVQLSIKRINYTTVSYRLEVKENDKVCSQKGVADISSFFFLGSESDTNELSGETFLTTEFTMSKDNCETSLRIGQSEPESEYLAKMIINCLEGCSDINLDNCPILIQS